MGAPVEVLGVEVGRVEQVRLRQDPKTRHFHVEAEADLFPLRVGLPLLAPADARQALKRLVDDGLRAELRTGNLLTGQAYIALDYPQRPTPVRFDTNAAVPELPTVPGAFSELQPQLMQIVRRLGSVRFDLIGESLQSTLQTADGTLKSLTPEAREALASLRRALDTADGVMRELGPEAKAALGGVQATLRSADRTLQGLERQVGPGAAGGGLQATLEEFQRSARALRQLADYLQRHPQSLLRGAPADPVLAPAAQENAR
ncbi:MlaD family protein [Aquabacterium sp. J223]|nr:MlaD family protein [Aquabacterium sp. J223]